MDAFVDSARNYCELIESDQHDVRAIRRSLLALMQGVAALPAQATQDDNGREFPRRGHDGWAEDVKRLADLPIQYYRMAFDPLDAGDDSAVVGDVCDDLADIYGDLWHGLQAYDAGHEIYAANYWRDSYRDHWGQHAVGAVSALDAFVRRTCF